MLGIKQGLVPDYLKLPPRPTKPKPEKREKFVPYRYAKRTGPIVGERLRRIAKNTSKWRPYLRTPTLLR
jgi:hypothetical protein